MPDADDPSRTPGRRCSTRPTSTATWACPCGPGELNDDVRRSDIRRWAQAMHYPNPLHYDERWAAESRFGELVAPQSFTVACDTSHGCSPAQVGRIPNSHLIFGGDEWWFFGPRIVAGDHLVCHRMPYDYKVTETSFAGPTCFQRGDTLYINQRGERVALQRSTAIRYPVREAKEKKVFDEARDPEWTDAELDGARGAQDGLHRPDPAARPRQAPVLERGRRRPAGRARPRAAQPGQLHHRVAGLPHDDLGRDEDRDPPP